MGVVLGVVMQVGGHRGLQEDPQLQVGLWFVWGAVILVLRGQHAGWQDVCSEDRSFTPSNGGEKQNDAVLTACM